MLEIVKTALASVEVSGLGRAGLGELISRIGQIRARLDALEARAITAVEALAGDGSGPVSAELMRANGGCSHREARRRIRRAGALAEMPATARALAEGVITSEHADALVRAAEATSAETVETDLELLERVKSRPADLAAREVTDWTHLHQSAEDREARFRRQRERRSHRMWIDPDGTVNSKGRFDPVIGAQIKAVIDDISNRLYRMDGGREGKPDQVRTWEQRNADAIAIAVGAEAGPAFGAEANALGRDERQARGRDRFDLSLRNQITVIAHTGAITGAEPGARCEIPGTGPIPRSELERLACEAEIFGVLFDGDGLPVWHGRRLRTVSPQQWRALAARDRGCVLCGASPGYCHAHHIVAWTAPTRGPTDIDNLVMVCNRHHRHIHQHRLTLTRGPDGRWATGGPSRSPVTPRAGP